MTKKKLRISFSGGRTSGYMLYLLWNNERVRNEYDISVVFANTGKEVSGTLVFVNKCSWKWGIPIVWVEAKHIDENGEPWSKKGWQVKHKIVDYFTASRKGEPFQEMISVLGIPSTNSPFCSYQLKAAALNSYSESIGWDDYYTAIGIRYDEKNRISKFWKENKIMYPLVNPFPVYKKMVNDWWKLQDFDLDIHKDEGNCDGCWKKDMKTLTRLARRKPETFDWWQEMTDMYGHLNPRNVDLLPPFNFYRGNLSPNDIFKLSKLQDTQLDLFVRKEGFNMCSESCEAF